MTLLGVHEYIEQARGFHVPEGEGRGWGAPGLYSQGGMRFDHFLCSGGLYQENTPQLTCGLFLGSRLGFVRPLVRVGRPVRYVGRRSRTSWDGAGSVQ